MSYNQNNAASNQFERLFSPRGVAVVGATEDSSRPGGEALNALRQFGYRGSIYPVNPKYRQMAGLQCYASLHEVDGIVDAAIVAVPAASTIGVIKSCGDRGIPYAVVLSGGFREAGPDGIKLQEEMLTYARSGRVRVLGPNCVGIVNFHENMFAAFGILTRPPLHNPGPVSMVMQSGGFGNGLAFSCRAAGIGFRIIVASGNEADLTAPQLINALIDDPKTEIILAYLEGVSDGRALMAASDRALAAGKPILVWKAGNTREGARMAATHTANMTGTYDVWRAALRQAGIIEVTEFEEAVDYIKVLLTKRLPRGRNVAVLSPSGGSAVVFSDAADKYGLVMPAPNTDTAQLMSEALPNSTSVKNPIDLGAGGILSKKNQTLKAVKALLDDESMHQVCLMTPVVVGERAKAQATMLAEAASYSDKPILVFLAAPRDAALEAFEIFERAKVSVLPSPNRVARAARMLASYAEFRALRNRVHSSPSGPKADLSPSSNGKWAAIDSGALDELESKKLLSDFGIKVTHDVSLKLGDEDAIDKIRVNFPVAVKVLSSEIAHKSDVGGVILNVKDRQALKAAASEVVGNARRASPAARINGILVSEMVTDGTEVILGVLNDSVFGPVVLLGMGGIFAEVLRDITYRVAPFDKVEARAMIGELRAYRILNGVRGKPACDVDALAGTLVNLSELAWQQRAHISEIDINPLMIRPQGLGVIAADALVVLRRNDLTA